MEPIKYPQKWAADEVKRVKIGTLLPYAKNSRTHTAAQIKQIAASIQEWGWTTPILIDEAGQIIAGHARVLAAKRLSLAEVPVMVATGWTDEQKRAYVIADNQLALNAGWDSDLLALELGELKAANFDMALIAIDPPAPIAPEAHVQRSTNFVLHQVIVFDDVDQQTAWVGFVKHLRATYPGETLAAGLARFTVEGGYVR